MLIMANQSINSTPQMNYKDFVARNYTEVSQVIKYVAPDTAYKIASDILPSETVYLSASEKERYEASVNRLYQSTGVKLF